MRRTAVNLGRSRYAYDDSADIGHDAGNGYGDGEACGLLGDGRFEWYEGGFYTKDTYWNYADNDFHPR